MKAPEIEQYEVKSELNRKAFESIEFLINKLNAGAITPHQFGTGIDVLWMAVSGLVNEDIIDLITAGGNEAPARPPIEKRVFMKGDVMVAAQREVGSDVVTIVTYQNSVKIGVKNRDCGSSSAARDLMQKIVGGLASAGYTEV